MHAQPLRAYVRTTEHNRLVSAFSLLQRCFSFRRTKSKSHTTELSRLWYEFNASMKENKIFALITNKPHTQGRRITKALKKTVNYDPNRKQNQSSLRCRTKDTFVFVITRCIRASVNIVLNLLNMPYIKCLIKTKLCVFAVINLIYNLTPNS